MGLGMDTTPRTKNSWGLYGYTIYCTKNNEGL